MIGIVDTGVGNVLSVRRAIEHVTNEPLGFWGMADKLVMAGQGSFASIDAATKMLLARRLGDGTPYLGICLGMQILYNGSDEAPEEFGLGFLSGRVRRLAGKTPRMGYEDVLGIGRMYFAHSYSAGADIVQHENVTGVQFHPEKSGSDGLRWLSGWFEGVR